MDLHTTPVLRGFVDQEEDTKDSVTGTPGPAPSSLYADIEVFTQSSDACRADLSILSPVHYAVWTSSGHPLWISVFSSSL